MYLVLVILRHSGLEHIWDSVTNLKQQQRWPTVSFSNIPNYGIQATSRSSPIFWGVTGYYWGGHSYRPRAIYKSHAFHVSAFMQSPCYPIYWCRTLHSMSSTGDGSLMTVKPQASFNNEMVHTVLLYTYNVGQGNSETLQEYCVWYEFSKFLQSHTIGRPICPFKTHNFTNLLHVRQRSALSFPNYAQNASLLANSKSQLLIEVPRPEQCLITLICWHFGISFSELPWCTYPNVLPPFMSV